MNVKQLITLSTLAFAATAALAESPTVAADTFVAQKTRAEVQAEVLQARADGTLAQYGEAQYRLADAAGPSTLTREQVRAEALAAPKERVANNGRDA